MSARVLLVGDVSGLGDVLSRSGHEVATTASIEEALGRTIEGVECAISSRELPDGTGFELAEAIRDRDPVLPVVVVGTESLEDVAGDAVHADVAGYVSRSDGFEERVTATVEDAIETYRRRRDRARLPRDGPDPGCVLREGTIVAATPDCPDMLGVDTLVDRPLSELIASGDRESVRAAIEDADETSNEVEFAPANAPDRRIEGRLRRTPDGAVVMTLLDVTDRVERSEELERQNKRLEQFAEVLTHDLRSPLNVAQGYLDLVRMDPDEDAIEACADALSHIGSLVDEVEESVLQGRSEPDPVPIDLEAAAREAWATVDTGDATLRVEGDERIRADPTQFRRLLDNLFRNAVEHGTGDAAKRGEGLTVRVVALEDGFAVEDDGVGLPSDVADDVFEHGFTTHEEGSGLGLSIVRNIARTHGWDVSVGTSESGGARFTFSGVLRPGEAVIEMEAGGADIWNGTDRGHFYYAEREGDFDVRVEVLSVENTHAWAKGGIMVRSSMDPGAPHVMIRRRPDGHSTVQWRPDDSVDARSLTSFEGRPEREGEAAEPTHDWLRLTREGDTIRAYTSENGDEWVLLAELDESNVALPEEVLLGVGGTSHNRAEATTIRFTNLDGVSPETSEDIGDPLRSGSVRRIDPALVSAHDPTDVTPTSATFRGAVESLQASDELDVRFEYREVTATEWSRTETRTVSAVGEVSASVDDLSPRRYYEYRVVADYGEGEIEHSSTRLVGTPGESPGADREGPRSSSHFDPGDGFADLAPWLDDDTPIVRITDPDREQLQTAAAIDGPRVIVFETSGTIDLGGRDVTVTGEQCWIAGQTAPSPGVTLVRGRLAVLADECVIQHLRVRPGDGGPDVDGGLDKEAILVDNGVEQTTIDHCTLTWSPANNLNLNYRNDRTTVTNCLLAEGLYDTDFFEDTGGYGTLVGDDSRDVALVGNVWTHHKGRCPRLRGGTASVVVNNFAYDFGYAIYIGDPSSTDTRASIVGNHYRTGSFSHPPEDEDPIVTAEDETSDPTVHLSDTIVEPETHPLISEGIREVEERPLWPAELEAMAARDVLEHNLRMAGARPADRTPHDERIVEEARDEAGRVIDSQEEVGGYPDLPENRETLEIPDRNLRAWLRERARAVEPTDT